MHSALHVAMSACGRTEAKDSASLQALHAWQEAWDACWQGG